MRLAISGSCVFSCLALFWLWNHLQAGLYSFSWPAAQEHLERKCIKLLNGFMPYCLIAIPIYAGSVFLLRWLLGWSSCATKGWDLRLGRNFVERKVWQCLQVVQKLVNALKRDRYRYPYFYFASQLQELGYGGIASRTEWEMEEEVSQMLLGAHFANRPSHTLPSFAVFVEPGFDFNNYNSMNKLLTSIYIYYTLQ